MFSHHSDQMSQRSQAPQRRLIVFLKVLTIVGKAAHRERFNHEMDVAEVSH